MSLITFQREIEYTAKKKVKLKVNDNHSTMLSVRWGRDCTFVSMHRIFLDAPQNIMDALACHISTENSDLAPTVKAFIEERVRSLDYSQKITSSKLSTQGKVYNLKEMYDSINIEYFNGKLKLAITWFGRPNPGRVRSKVTFGLYQEALKLVKIHRIMDRKFFPEYFVRFVIYHEMLHHICPGYVTEKGHTRVHTKEFRQKEKAFREYDKAMAWMQKYYEKFFIL